MEWKTDHGFGAAVGMTKRLYYKFEMSPHLLTQQVKVLKLQSRSLGQVRNWQNIAPWKLPNKIRGIPQSP